MGKRYRWLVVATATANVIIGMPAGRPEAWPQRRTTGSAEPRVVALDDLVPAPTDDLAGSDDSVALVDPDHIRLDPAAMVDAFVDPAVLATPTTEGCTQVDARSVTLRVDGQLQPLIADNAERCYAASEPEARNRVVWGGVVENDLGQTTGVATFLFPLDADGAPTEVLGQLWVAGKDIRLDPSGQPGVYLLGSPGPVIDPPMGTSELDLVPLDGPPPPELSGVPGDGGGTASTRTWSGDVLEEPRPGGRPGKRVVEVLFGYASGMTERDASAFAATGTLLMNRALQNSGIPVSMRNVGVVAAGQPQAPNIGKDLTWLSDRGDHLYDTLTSAWDASGADTLALLVPRSSGYCGIGAIPFDVDADYSWVNEAYTVIPPRAARRGSRTSSGTTSGPTTTRSTLRRVGRRRSRTPSGTTAWESPATS